MKFNPSLNDRRRTAFDALLDRFFEDVPATEQVAFTPRVDIAETERNFEIEVAVPGMKKEDFHIEVEEDRLIISGERKYEKEQSGKNYRSVETQFGRFSRSFYLPDAVKKEDIQATYTNGLLQLVIPKDTQKQLKKVVKVS
jgi:HSP20 family protein